MTRNVIPPTLLAALHYPMFDVRLPAVAYTVLLGSREKTDSNVIKVTLNMDMTMKLWRDCVKACALLYALTPRIAKDSRKAYNILLLCDIIYEDVNSV